MSARPGCRVWAKRGAVAALVVVGVLSISARRFLVREAVPGVIPISSSAAYQDAALLERAWSAPVAASYRQAGVVYQPNGSVCGPTSLANVDRSLGLGAATPDTVLAGSGKCPWGICFGGLTLDELALLAERTTGRHARVVRDLDLAGFRAELAHVADEGRRYVANFDRGPLFGFRGGHHSPIGAWLSDRDLVLVIDVNQKYEPWLVPSERLFQAMDTVDPSSGKKRGLLVIE